MGIAGAQATVSVVCVPTRGLDAGPHIKSQEELGQRIRCETSFRTLLGVEQGCVGIFGRYRCHIGGTRRF